MKAFHLLMALAIASPAAAAAAPTSNVIIAKPEARNTIRAGDTIVFPLYDAKGGVTLYGTSLRKLGARAIAKGDLPKNMDYGVPSPHGEAYLAVKPGQVSGSLLLTLPKNKMVCVSCRTVHYFVTVLPKR